MSHTTPLAPARARNVAAPSGGTGIYQILASKRNQGAWSVLLSRRDLYVDRDGRFEEVS